MTSAFVKEALDRGAELFDWDERKARERQATRARRCAASASPSARTRRGLDRLRRPDSSIKPDGRSTCQSGVGNLGTHSVFDLHRVAAEMLGVPWEQVDVVWGNTRKHLPWTCLSVGSQTTHAMTRAKHAAATDAKRKLQEIAAKDLGGSPDDYELAGERRVGAATRRAV